MLANKGGTKRLIAENIMLRKQLIIVSRQRSRSPNIGLWDRLCFAFLTALVSTKHLPKIAIVIKPSILIKFHKAMVKRKYSALFSNKAKCRPGPPGPSQELINTILEMKKRNPRFGCRRIAMQMSVMFGININKDVVWRILSKHYKPISNDDGPSWLSFLGNTKDSLWSVVRAELPQITIHRPDPFHKIIQSCKCMPAIRTAVVHPVQASVIGAVADAVSAELITPILIGPKAKIQSAASEAGIDLSQWEIIDTEHSDAAAAKAVELAACGKADAIMKGSLHTDELMAAIVPTASSLRTKYRISHAYVMDVPSYHKPLIITDAAINIAPNAADKADICQNAINLWRILHGEDKKPKVAILAAVELLNPKMQATVDAAILCKMADRGQITDGILDGPLAFDNAISKEAADEKGIFSPVAGDPDILLVPEIESGNILAKQLTFLEHADAAGIVLGARVPIILVSRADSLRTRLLSCALAVQMAAARSQGKIK